MRDKNNEGKKPFNRRSLLKKVGGAGVVALGGTGSASAKKQQNRGNKGAVIRKIRRDPEARKLIEYARKEAYQTPVYSSITTIRVSADKFESDSGAPEELKTGLSSRDFDAGIVPLRGTGRAGDQVGEWILTWNDVTITDESLRDDYHETQLHHIKFSDDSNGLMSDSYYIENGEVKSKVYTTEESIETTDDGGISIQSSCTNNYTLYCEETPSMSCIMSYMATGVSCMACFVGNVLSCIGCAISNGAIATGHCNLMNYCDVVCPTDYNEPSSGGYVPGPTYGCDSYNPSTGTCNDYYQL